jgi:hypothetical protein
LDADGHPDAHVATALMLVMRALTCQPQHRDAAPHGLAVTENSPSNPYLDSDGVFR